MEYRLNNTSRALACRSEETVERKKPVEDSLSGRLGRVFWHGPRRGKCRASDVNAKIVSTPGDLTRLPAAAHAIPIPYRPREHEWALTLSNSIRIVSV